MSSTSSPTSAQRLTGDELRRQILLVNADTSLSFEAKGRKIRALMNGEPLDDDNRKSSSNATPTPTHATPALPSSAAAAAAAATGNTTTMRAPDSAPTEQELQPTFWVNKNTAASASAAAARGAAAASSAAAQGPAANGDEEGEVDEDDDDDEGYFDIDTDDEGDGDGDGDGVEVDMEPEAEEPEAEEPGPEWERDAEELRDAFGCAHYKVNAKIRAPCCHAFFTCRFCHDEQTSHAIDRFAIKEMMCMFCKHVQPLGGTCTSCGKSIARYCCTKCNLLDDTPNKHIYHCDRGCGICRVGQGEGIDFKHCRECNFCLPIQNFSTHRCLSDMGRSLCPICRELLFTSRQPVVVLSRCGHPIHQSCLNDHIQSSMFIPVCPICCKSVSNNTAFYEQLDRMLALETVPVEFQDRRDTILCNDCEKINTVKFHFLYHKCPPCGSYNTKRIEESKAPQPSSQPAGPSTEAPPQ